jgi:SAM-dependent methyltransferase
MMFSLELLKRPKPFEEGNLTLWSDDYIADNVLRRHLDGNVDSGSRKRNTIIEAAKWITSKCIEKSCILDIGCGPGLYADLLCEGGFTYHGIDASKYQIKYAIENCSSENVTFEIVDFRKYQPSEEYCAVLLLYGIYSLYDYNDRIELLNKIKKCLKTKGKIFIEVFTKQHYANRKETRDWEYVIKDGFWSKNSYLELNAFYRYDNLDLYLVQAAKVQDDIYVWNAWTQTFSPESLIEELKVAGFKKFDVYGSCTGEPYNEDCEVICICAE